MKAELLKFIEARQKELLSLKDDKVIPYNEWVHKTNELSSMSMKISQMEEVSLSELTPEKNDAIEFAIWLSENASSTKHAEIWLNSESEEVMVHELYKEFKKTSGELVEETPTLDNEDLLKGINCNDLLNETKEYVATQNGYDSWGGLLTYYEEQADEVDPEEESTLENIIDDVSCKYGYDLAQIIAKLSPPIREQPITEAEIEKMADEYCKEFLPGVDTTGHWLGFQEGYKKAQEKAVDKGGEEEKR